MFPLTPDQHHWLEVATEDEGWNSLSFRFTPNIHSIILIYASSSVVSFSNNRKHRTQSEKCWGMKDKPAATHNVAGLLVRHDLIRCETNLTAAWNTFALRNVRSHGRSFTRQQSLAETDTNKRRIISFNYVKIQRQQQQQLQDNFRPLSRSKPVSDSLKKLIIYI